MKTFNYESNCVKYRDCFFDMGEYSKGRISLAIYGYNVEEELPEEKIVNKARQ